MKDMGEANIILGNKIKRENKGIVITQSHYIEKILKKFNREDCSPVSTPMDLVEKLKPNTGKPVDQLEYSRVIGCLMYAMTSTRPNIAYAVGRLSRFTSNPSRQHWQAITRVFKYLKGTMNYGLSYMGYPSVLEGVISWASKKQTCITGSTMESEFVALAAAGARLKESPMCLILGFPSISVTLVVARVGPLSGKGPRVIVSADASDLPRSLHVHGGVMSDDARITAATVAKWHKRSKNFDSSSVTGTSRETLEKLYLGMIKNKGVEGGSSELKVDIYDPLYLHSQDIGFQLITFKLEGTENYKVLAHPSDQVLIVLKSKIKDLAQINSGSCDICHKAKQTREPFALSEHKSKNLGDLVHLDVWGPYKVVSRDGFRLPTVVLAVLDEFDKFAFSNTSSRKDISGDEYATETIVSEGIQGTDLHDDESESEGEDIESFDVKYSINKVVNYSNLSVDNFVLTTSINKIYESTTYLEVVKDSRWIEAMNQEMEALNRNNTWEITDLLSNRKPIGCKWVFRVKYKANDEVERFKARLVAKGFNQREGIDYEETFSPVVKIVTVRCVSSLAINNKWSLFQLDINNAFLYGDLEEDVYMSMPEGYSDKNDKKVGNLVKSLYGLKQAPRKWNEKLSSILLENGFVKSVNDFSLFIKNDQDIVLILLVYVDDIVITGNNLDEITKFKQFLSGICLTQRKYCTELLSEFGMLACKPCSTPIDVNPENKKVISKFGDDEPLTGITQYQKLVVQAESRAAHIAEGLKLLKTEEFKGHVGRFQVKATYSPSQASQPLLSLFYCMFWIYSSLSC
ncbi:ribonuclease H-like domain-containing protein [Tanacetum coccineum]